MSKRFFCSCFVWIPWDFCWSFSGLWWLKSDALNVKQQASSGHWMTVLSAANFKHVSSHQRQMCLRSGEVKTAQKHSLWLGFSWQKASRCQRPPVIGEQNTTIITQNENKTFEKSNTVVAATRWICLIGIYYKKRPTWFSAVEQFFFPPSRLFWASGL